MSEFVLVALLLAQFGVGIWLYLDARNDAKRAIRHFSDKADEIKAATRHVDARVAALGHALAVLHNRVEAISDVSLGWMHSVDQQVSHLQQQITTFEFPNIDKNKPGVAA